LLGLTRKTIAERMRITGNLSDNCLLLLPVPNRRPLQRDVERDPRPVLKRIEDGRSRVESYAVRGDDICSYDGPRLLNPYGSYSGPILLVNTIKHAADQGHRIHQCINRSSSDNGANALKLSLDT